jgi:hypothetical protein
MKHFLLYNFGTARRSACILHLLLFGILLTTSTIIKAQTGKSLQFDGVNDFVKLPVQVTGDYTKEVWINASSTTGFPNIITGTGTALFINNGHLAAGHADGGFTQLLDPATLSTGVWYHVAVSYNATTGNMKLYKDGVLVASAASVPNYSEPSLNLSLFSGGSYFSGLMDEVRLWKTERSLAQLVSTKNCELTGDEPSLLAYYKFDQGIAGGNNASETSLLDLADKCVTSNGTLNNFALTGITSNWVAASPSLTGICSSTFPNISLLGNQTCIADGDQTPSVADNTNFGSVGVRPVVKEFVIKNTGSAVLNIGVVTITGADASSFSLATLPAAVLNPGDSTSFKISFAPGGAMGVKNAAVTINNDDEDEATFNFNISGNFAGQGMALSFDGINDRVEIPLAFSGNYTKEAWVKTQSLTATPNILTGNTTNGTALFLINGRLAAGHGPSFNQIQDATTLVAGTWYHVAVTFDAATREMKLYKNAVLVATAPNVPAYSETFLQLGSFAGGYFFTGTIDEVRIWNSVRTQSELLANRDCALSGSEPSLLAYYNFNTGVVNSNNPGDSILNDLHGLCPVNGKLVNFALVGTASNWVAPGAPISGSCTVQVPNISAAGNSICIQTGDTTPSFADSTDFGTIPTGTTLDKTYVITNNGGADLNIIGISITGPDASSFSIIASGDPVVLPGFSTFVTVRFSPSAAGQKNATLNIANNDADELVYNFAITGNANGTLPVTLLYFRAANAGKTALLTWETAQESMSLGFEVQRAAADGAYWETIGFIRSSNNASGSRYSFTDLVPLKGNNAYRLKQLDIDGKFSLSSIEILNFKLNISSVYVYPNPVQDILKIVHNDRMLLNSYATIRSASGASVKIVLLNSFQQNLDVSSLPKGIYFISFTSGKVLRVVKN